MLALFDNLNACLGKVVVNVRKLNLDLYTVVGHKFGAPKGKYYKIINCLHVCIRVFRNWCVVYKQEQED